MRGVDLLIGVEVQIERSSAQSRVLSLEKRNGARTHVCQINLRKTTRNQLSSVGYNTGAFQIRHASVTYVAVDQAPWADLGLELFGHFFPLLAAEALGAVVIPAVNELARNAKPLLVELNPPHTIHKLGHSNCRTHRLVSDVRPRVRDRAVESLNDLRHDAGVRHAIHVSHRNLQEDQGKKCTRCSVNSSTQACHGTLPCLDRRKPAPTSTGKQFRPSETAGSSSAEPQSTVLDPWTGLRCENQTQWKHQHAGGHTKQRRLQCLVLFARQQRLAHAIRGEVDFVQVGEERYDRPGSTAAQTTSAKDGIEAKCSHTHLRLTYFPFLSPPN